MVADGPAETLTQTVNTQPVMLTAGVAAWRLWLEKGGRQPAVVAGHSLGEYSALVAAGVIDFRDAVPLVRLRAAAMQEAVPFGTGAMAAILSLHVDDIFAACAEAAQGEVVEAVNFNDTVQTVIAGHKGAVERAMVACKARGAKRAVPLPVSAPFHSSLIRPAADKLAGALTELDFKAPRIPVINNVDVAVESDPARIKEALVRQAYNPVRWVETIQKMGSMGVAMVAECGPGKVLSKLTKRCVHEMEGIALADEASIDSHLNLE
jgi:[acyl-carrier-protein] S-malonyltransferase